MHLICIQYFRNKLDHVFLKEKQRTMLKNTTFLFCQVEINIKPLIKFEIFHINAS